MTEPITMKVEGFAELLHNMRMLDADLQDKALKPGVNAAASVVKKQARANAARIFKPGTGILQKAIYQTRSRSLSGRGQETAVVGIRYGRKYRRRGQDAFYWRWLEFGTAKLVAMPFIRPAFESTKMEQLKAMRDGIARGITRITAKFWGKK